MKTPKSISKIKNPRNSAQKGSFVDLFRAGQHFSVATLKRRSRILRQEILSLHCEHAAYEALLASRKGGV